MSTLKPCSWETQCWRCRSQMHLPLPPEELTLIYTLKQKAWLLLPAQASREDADLQHCQSLFLAPIRDVLSIRFSAACLLLCRAVLKPEASGLCPSAWHCPKEKSPWKTQLSMMGTALTSGVGSAQHFIWAMLPMRNLMFYSTLRSSRSLDPLHEENRYHISCIMSDQSDHSDLAPEVPPSSSPPPIKEAKTGTLGSWCSSTHPYPISLFQAEEAASCLPWWWLFLSAESTWEAKTSLALPQTCRLAARVSANAERKTKKTQPNWLTRG